VILHYYKSSAGNFGDDINTWLWERLLPGQWYADDGIYFAGTGTIITQSMPKARQWIVLGSGAGYGPPPADFGGPNWWIMSVRGPLTAEVLKLPREKAVTDGALLLNHLPEFAPLPEAERNGIVFVPHHQALEAGDWPEVCRRAGLEYLGPTGDSGRVIQRLRRARKVIADSMHAAIVADALRVPWVPVATSAEINSFKWLDWTQSMNLDYRPLRLTASTFEEAIRSVSLALHGQRYLISSPTIANVMAHYRRATAIKGQPWWPYVQRAGERLYSSVLRRGVRLVTDIGLSTAQQRRLDAAARDLCQAASSSPHLSDDRMWRERSAQLLQQVESLRTRPISL
jgi:succinoglycan biosynthesis protein ExoV